MQRGVETNGHLLEILERMPVALGIYRVETEEIVLLNRKFTELFGYTFVDLPNVGRWFPLAYPDPAYRRAVMEDWISRVERVQTEGIEIEPMETRVTCRDGQVRYIRFEAIASGDLAIVTFTDLTDMKRMQDDLQALARTDALTGIANRRHFLEICDAELVRARRHGQPVSLLLLDVDRFKRINDLHGHPAGDKVLREIADACNAQLRETDAMGRLGGEEFGILLPMSGAADGMVVAERLRAVVGRLRIDDGRGNPLSMTVSLGVSHFLGDSDTLESLFARADRALYEAKRTGRDRACQA